MKRSAEVVAWIKNSRLSESPYRLTHLSREVKSYRRTRRARNRNLVQSYRLYPHMKRYSIYRLVAADTYIQGSCTCSRLPFREPPENLVWVVQVE